METRGGPGRSSALSAIADAARRPRPVWRSERAYVVATIAGVVGLGNVWRFPYMMGRHGGGSFLVAYIVCVLVIAIPLAAIESVAGSLGRRSPVGTLRWAAGRTGATLGWMIVAMTVAILSYYLVVTGWTLGYFLDSLTGQVSSFAEFATGYRSLWLLLAVGGLLAMALVRGVAAIERASLHLVPLLVIIVVGLAIFGQSLEGAGQARSFLLGLSGEQLTDTATWRAAAGQAFYSVGIGQGILIAYGSFVPAGTNLVRSTATVAVTNSLVSIVSGLMVFSVVFSFGISPTTGSQLSFTAFPRVFGELSGGAFIAGVFFSLLFLAGFTSCIGGAVVVQSTLRDELGVGARRAVLMTVGLVVFLGVPSALSFTEAGLTIGGQPVLDRIDQITGSGVIVVLGLVSAAVLARTIPRRRLVAGLGAEPLRLGANLEIDPGLVAWWVAYLPIVAAGLYLIATIM